MASQHSGRDDRDLLSESDPIYRALTESIIEFGQAPSEDGPPEGDGWDVQQLPLLSDDEKEAIALLPNEPKQVAAAKDRDNAARSSPKG